MFVAFHPSKSEKLLLFDTVQSELEEKIRRLEEDRHSIDITSGTGQPAYYAVDMLYSLTTMGFPISQTIHNGS